MDRHGGMVLAYKGGEESETLTKVEQQNMFKIGGDEARCGDSGPGARVGRREGELNVVWINIGCFVIATMQMAVCTEGCLSFCE